MSNRSGSHQTNPAQRALAHPVRARLLAELRDGPSSPSRLAEVVGQPVGVVSYHVRILLEAGLLRLVGTAPKRGAVEHFYAPTESQPVGRALRVTPEAAEALRQELAAAISRAEQHPGDVSAVVVAHLHEAA